MSLLASMRIQGRKYDSSFYLKMIGGTHNKKMIEAVKNIWNFSLSKEITVTAEYFQRSLNVTADLTFRNFRDLYKRLLTPQGNPEEVDSRNESVCIQNFSSDPSFYGINSRVKQQMLSKKIGAEGYYSMHLLLFHYERVFPYFFTIFF